MTDTPRNSDPQAEQGDRDAQDLSARSERQPGSTGPRQPDTAGSNDFDDEGIPTYRGPSSATNSTTAADRLYDRTGRAAPQSIEPGAGPKAGADSGAEVTQVRPRLRSVRVVSDSPATEVFGHPAEPVPRQAATPDPHSGRLASDAPTSSVDEPPTTVAPRVAASASVPPQPPVEPTRQLHRPEENYADTDFAPAQPAAPVVVPAEQPQVAAPYQEQPMIVEDARRGTLDLGLLIIRAAVGGYLILRGVLTFFSIGGSPGLAGLETEFAGYQLPQVLSILVPSLELAAGVFLLLGLMTPVAAAVATVATSFTALHQITVHEGAWGELAEPVVLAVLLTLVVVGLQFTGPGRISLDAGRGWARRPLASSWIFVIIGIALAVVLWWFGVGVNPLGGGALVQP